MGAPHSVLFRGNGGLEFGVNVDRIVVYDAARDKGSNAILPGRSVVMVDAGPAIQVFVVRHTVKELFAILNGEKARDTGRMIDFESVHEERGAASNLSAMDGKH